MADKGRRPGKRDTRAEIVAAARAAFSADGFEGTSLRAVAARAGVDPALIHHYFAGGKSELFTVAMEEAPDPRLILDQVIVGHPFPVPGAPDPTTTGGVIVANFLRMWDEVDQAEPGAAFVSFVQAASSSPEAAAGVREFLAERIWSQLGDGGRSPDDLARRRALIASQLMGLGFVRYVLRLEPVASADVADLAAWAGPAVDRYHDGELDEPPATAAD